jgi:ribosomal peptide maturation radical SAM protein 1
MPDVALIVVPFADVERPAIGVSLLKSEVARAGFDCTVHYLNFDLAELIGKQLYTTFSEALPAESLVGEWFFADLVFGDAIPPAEQYAQKILARLADNAVLADMMRARAVRDRFIEDSVRKIQDSRARIVGFSTTFHQTCCCLAIARRLKQIAEPPVIVFGGANCEGEMGMQMLRSFPWIDHVCTGEGDVAFPALVERTLRSGDVRGIQGILSQGHSVALSTPDLVEHLDELPDPDYQDYFARLALSDKALQVVPELPIETARGCWWGAKHHCTFCGLNGATMPFRSKSPERAFDEMCRLSQRWGVIKMNCVDNILDMRYFDSLLPRLASEGPGLEFFYEVKANLNRSQVKLLRAGGVRTIQPGIESFSNEVLKRMDKGCTGWQNIQLLRWCEEEGIQVAWNLLAGFPGESPADYARQAEWLPQLVHLQPPTSCSPIRLDRFSPLYTRADAFGLKRVRPTAAYFYVYPMGTRELSRLASFFDFDYADARAPAAYLAAAQRAVEKWIMLHAGDSTGHPRFDAFIQGDVLQLSDTRPCACQPARLFTGIEAQLYLACDQAQSLASLQRRFGAELSCAQMESLLAAWVADRLAIEMDGKYVSLAVIRNRPAEATTRGFHVPIPIAAAVAS